MEIEGLENNAYYLYNPIIVKLNDVVSRITMGVIMQGKTYYFDFYPNQNGIVTFDLSKIVLGLIPEIESLNTLPAVSFGNSVFNFKGAYSIVLRFRSTTVDQGIAKTFVLGGSKDYKKNVPVIANDLNLNLDKWEGYTSYDFKLEENIIKGHKIIETNQRKRVECDDIYLFFRNHKGGFSGYLFEDFDIQESGKDLGYYLTMDNIIDSGTEVKKELTVRTKAKRKHFEVMEDLAISKEIYILKNNDLTRIIGGNKFTRNPKLSVTDVSFSFGIIINYNSQW